MIRSSYKGVGGGLGPICWTWRAKSSLLFLTAMVLSMMFLMGWEAAPLSILLFGIPARAEDSIPAAAVAASSSRAADAATTSQLAATAGGPVSCDYSSGKWVPADDAAAGGSAAAAPRPLYSGKECSQRWSWLTPEWSCELNNRPDLSYEQFRWQPSNYAQGCDLTPFHAHTFLERYVTLDYSHV
jgi:hypothetical protein